MLKDDEIIEKLDEKFEIIQKVEVINMEKIPYCFLNCFKLL